MSTGEKHTRNHRARRVPAGLVFLAIVLAVPILTGCQTASPEAHAAASERSVQRTYTITHLTAGQCEVLLRPLGLEQIRCTSQEDGTILVAQGTPDRVRAAQVVLDVVDSRDDYCVENLGPASGVRALPSNRQIAAALGNINIGTFTEPPGQDARPRAIIDVQADSVLAFLPVRYRVRLHALLASNGAAGRPRTAASVAGKPGEPLPGLPTETAAGPSPSQAGQRVAESNDAAAAGREGREEQPETAAPQIPTVLTLTEMAGSADANAKGKDPNQSSAPAKDSGEPPKTVKIRFAPRPKDPERADVKTATDKALPANGEDLLTLTLPETVTLVQLLDLVGKHVGLKIVSDPREIGSQSISLKLQGNLQGQMKVKHLYALLETELDFMGLAMIRRDDDLVAVVPIEKALQSQPQLVDAGHDGVQVGDMVVTRVFDIQHVDVSSVINLLQNMKLSLAATPLDNSNLLLVTCHTGRMNRIEQLVDMIDRPGQALECRFRRLSYVRATPLVAKLRTLAGELEGIVVAPPPGARPPAAPATAKPATAKPSTSALTARPAVSRPAEPAGQKSVYLDTDERTNRILMIGSAEELTLLEELVDILDVAQEDPRSPHIYTLKHLSAPQALDKLQTLEILASSGRGTAASEAAAANEALTGEPLVAVLEATNQLVVKAAPDQHTRIREFLQYIDVVPTDMRTIVAYRIQHIDVHAAQEALEGLDLVQVDSKASSFIAGPNQPRDRPGAPVPIPSAAGRPAQKAPMVVSEAARALIVKATPEEHTRIAAILQYIDRYTPEEQWSYRVYPLENSSPDHLASLLERLIQETIKDKDGKIEKITPKTQEKISIVPDPNTFSVIVYANQKSQKWIEGLISRLDKRRPQVLIDVTLVEITRTDTFEYDLNLVASVNNPVIGNLVVDPIQRADSGRRLEGGFNLLDQEGNPTGRTRVFYSDENVQALLTAMQRKNYGRVLAKPKVLVDDGRKGEIVTTDTTTYVKESIQIPQTGTPITTREFVPIDASIELQITPHISEGNLLRLEVFMSRDDFGTRPLSGAPPDKATSKLTSAVFVPDDSTVILGGLVKLNQSKGGSKVPILGDLPLVGVLFRSIDNSDIEKKLYVFLKANIVRPYDDSGLIDLQRISEEHRDAFEESESDFQKLESIPGIRPKPMPPEGVLRGEYE